VSVATIEAARTSGSMRSYEYDPSWGKLPEGVSAWGVVPAVVVDSQDRVYVHRRAARPVVVYSREGEILSIWGDRFETGSQGVHIRQELDGESIYFTDVAGRRAVKCMLD